jgi:hypothetical protein
VGDNDGVVDVIFHFLNAVLHCLLQMKLEPPTPVPPEWSNDTKTGLYRINATSKNAQNTNASLTAISTDCVDMG